MTIVQPPTVIATAFAPTIVPTTNPPPPPPLEDDDEDHSIQIEQQIWSATLAEREEQERERVSDLSVGFSKTRYRAAQSPRGDHSGLHTATTTLSIKRL